MIICKGVRRDGTGFGPNDLNTYCGIGYLLVLYSDIGAIYENDLSCSIIDYTIRFVINIDKWFIIHGIVCYNVITIVFRGDKYS